MSKNNCADPTHKPHAGLAGGYARLLTSLQWAVNFVDILSIRTEEEWLSYKTAHKVAWGIDPAVSKEQVLGDDRDDLD